jgi:hypothetical protein
LDLHTDSHAHTYPHCHSNGDAFTHSDAHADAYEYVHTHGYTYSYSNLHTDYDSYTDAASHVHASPTNVHLYSRTPYPNVHP